MNIGIDLGTTNSALAFVDPKQAADADFPEIRVLDVPQYVRAGTMESRRTLPSFLYLGDQEYVGVYARDQGALVPTKCVHSAKSWLSNPAVDRTAKILPWDAQAAGRILSPVEVSARILQRLGEAWTGLDGSPIGAHDIVLTVPASFDEEARELTVAAARDAGMEKLTLLEEPAAAFYSWIANDLARSQKSLSDGQLVLVCDVGGGTSDFTLIRVSRDGDRVDFTRTAVGKHLLLGGDNLDLTLAWLVESKLGKTLSIRQRSGLRRQCAAAKEQLLSDDHLASVEVTVLGSGSALVGGAMKTEILRDEVLELALDGFLPKCERADAPAEEDKSPFQELGLPLVSDPAITRHLAAFLRGAGDARPDAILFNGGFFIPEILRQRVADVMEHWCGRRPLIFENRDLDLAVAVGAAYYAYVRATGAGLLVRGGLPRAYFIGLGGGGPDGDGESLRTMCLVPRGAEEGSSVELDPGNLELIANKAVSFRLYSSRTRTEDRAGDVVEFPRAASTAGSGDGDLHLHAPLNALLRFGKTGERLVPVKLGARLTEVGTLEIWVDSKSSEHRWRLQFELRKAAAAPAASRPAAVVSEAAVASARALLGASFADSVLEPEQLPAQLEQTLGLGRASWPLPAIRSFADRLLELAEGRSRSAAHEARWLNLCGLCLRPGFGFPGDEFRVEQARRIYAEGLRFPSHVQNEIEWWIYWGRVAGGLNRNQQADLFQRMSATLLPRGSRRSRVNPSLLREMWRAASSLELLPIPVKTQLGDELIARIEKNDFVATGLWCLARLGARKLFYGPINQVLPAGTATRWLGALLKIQAAEDTVGALARRTGDATRDLAPQTLDLVRGAFPNLDLETEPEESLAAMGRVFGEELPAGLVFHE